jgi:hypothetical protein
MKRYLMILSVIALSLIMIVGCSKDKKNDNTGVQPASATQSTNANGLATLTLGANTVTATVQDAAHTGLQHINVSGYLSHDNVLVEAFDTSGTYYPSITVVPLTTVLAKSGLPNRINSPDEIASAAVAATLTMYPITWGAMGLDSSSGIDAIVDDAWTSEVWHTGLLTDMYNIIDTVSVFEDGVFIHLNQSVFDTSNSQFRTAVFIPNQISDFATFASLVGSEFQLFAEDTLHFCQLSYSGIALPVMFVDNIIMNRNFWAQFTLRWGETPRDIDSHLLTPSINGTVYHIRFNEQGEVGVAPYAQLDVDDVSSFGPEHLTIYQNFAGTYTYAVYNWSGEAVLAGCGASVTLIKPDGSVQTFNVPTDTTGEAANIWWHVCTIDGTTGHMTPINILSPDPPPGISPAKVDAKASDLKNDPVTR